jgi:hypothetical protein
MIRIFPFCAAAMTIKGYVEESIVGEGALLRFLRFPPKDIRGSRLGLRARKELCRLAADTEGTYEIDGVIVPKSIKPVLGKDTAYRKVLLRLFNHGIVVRGMVGGVPYGSTDHRQRVVGLTPNGRKLWDVFGDDIRSGQKIRWEKWQEPSWVYDYQEDTLDWEKGHGYASVDRSTKTGQPMHGTSSRYLMASMKESELYFGPQKTILRRTTWSY